MTTYQKPLKAKEFFLTIPNECTVGFYSINKIAHYLKHMNWSVTIVNNPMTTRYRIKANAKNISCQFRNREKLEVDIHRPCDSLSVTSTRAFLTYV